MSMYVYILAFAAFSLVVKLKLKNLQVNIS